MPALTTKGRWCGKKSFSQPVVKGKSHFAVAIANFFKKPFDSPEVQGILYQVEMATANKAQAIAERLRLYKQNQPYRHLVICLSGDRGGDIRKHFLEALCFFNETAFLDRFAGIIPGWKIPKFQREMAASKIGLKMDFFGESLLSLRQDNRFMSYAQQHTQFDKNATVRDQNAILKSASRFLKILYPHLDLTLMDYQRDCLELALNLRQAIRNSLYYLDDEFRQLGREIYVDMK